MVHSSRGVLSYVGRTKRMEDTAVGRSPRAISRILLAASRSNANDREKRVQGDRFSKNPDRRWSIRDRKKPRFANSARPRVGRLGRAVGGASDDWTAEQIARDDHARKDGSAEHGVRDNRMAHVGVRPQHGGRTAEDYRAPIGRNQLHRGTGTQRSDREPRSLRALEGKGRAAIDRESGGHPRRAHRNRNKTVSSRLARETPRGRSEDRPLPG